MAREEKSGVEKLKSRLYARKNVGKEVGGERATLTPNEENVPRAWALPKTLEEPLTPVAPLSPLEADAQSKAAEEAEAVGGVVTSTEPKKHMTFATKFLLGSAVFFLGALGVASVLFFGNVNSTSPNNIDVEVIAPPLIDGGKVSEIEILVTNRNTTSLELADLIIDYPEGARSPLDSTKALTHERISVGTIESGKQIKRMVSAIFYGNEGITEKILVRLEYTVSGSNSVFEKQGETSFTIGSAPVALTIEAPTKATAGDQFSFELTVRSNSATPVENVAVEAQYPFGFTFGQSNPTATGNIWRLGSMAPGSTKTITITGTIEAADGDERVFRFLVGSNTDPTDARVKVPFLVVSQTLVVERAFITGAIVLEGKTGTSISAPAGKTLNGGVEWENNLTEAITGLELSLTIDGPAVEKSSIQAQNGFYQSSNNTILWTSTADSALANVPPGGKGSYQFSFATLKPGAGNILITNPTVTLRLEVRGTRQLDEGGTTSNIASAANMKVVLASELMAAAEASRNGGPYTNSGPLPPRAEQGSTYTVTWTIKNSANTVANVVGQTLLPPYVTFTQGEAGITYDASTRIVKWSLGDVKPGVGYTSVPRSASFQVMFTPSVSQVGTTPPITGTFLVSGQDRFAQVVVEAAADAVTINTTDLSGMDTVLPKQ